jgi:hypothetical protein
VGLVTVFSDGWCGMVWYGMGMVWYGMVWYGILVLLLFLSLLLLLSLFLQLFQACSGWLVGELTSKLLRP